MVTVEDANVSAWLIFKEDNPKDKEEDDIRLEDSGSVSEFNLFEANMSLVEEEEEDTMVIIGG